MTRNRTTETARTSTPRRSFLKAAVPAAGGLLLAGPALRVTHGAPVRFSRDPFSLGVASGYPTSDSTLLWTRLAPEPLSGGGLVGPVTVDWEIAHDDRFTRTALKGRAIATADWAHSLHVEVRGLEPDRWYFYRFRAGDAMSPVGRTRTAPARGATRPLRFGVASCSHYEQGYFSAYRHMAEDNLDLAVHVGDYIYETSWGPSLARKHEAHFVEPVTLDDYRNRYALYKGDPDLQAAHAACPWLVTWDDHEVDNDYANDQSQDLDNRRWFLARRALAYKAYYEHMPLRRGAVPLGPDLRLHGQLSFGEDISFFVLDDRQYRSPQACPRPGRGGGNRADPETCKELGDGSRTLLGGEQEAWLAAGLERSKSKWNVIAQQTRMANLDVWSGPEKRFTTDGWDGYPAAKRRLLEDIRGSKAQNPLVLGGDVHSFWVCDLRVKESDLSSPVVATEFTGTSITSDSGQKAERTAAIVAENPHVKFADGTRHGYLRLELGPKEARVDLRVTSDITKPSATRETLASFVVESGRPGAQTA